MKVMAFKRISVLMQNGLPDGKSYIAPGDLCEVGEKTLAGLYHKDLIGRFVFRILRIFTVRRSEMLTSETLKTVYGYLDADEQLRLFNVRIGQFVNVLLYKIGWIWLSKLYYKTASGIFRLFR